MFRTFFTLLTLSGTILAQTPGEWTWMHGSNFTGSSAVYGTQGVPDPANTPPGYYEPVEWTDKQGNFWLFAGYGGGPATGSYGDVWKFDPVILQWTWMHGTGVPNPPVVLGTQGVSSPTNTPGMNQWCGASWVDTSGTFWLFGGSDGSSASYSLLWKYDPLINEWTWMHGPPTNGAPGIYGVQGVPDPANYPTARWETSATWTDDDNNLWLYGGLNAPGDYLWKYDIATNQWTWTRGSAAGGSPVYGTVGVSSPSNTPGQRQVYSKWKDAAGDLWLFGGSGTTNDLWRYNIISNEWTWMSGANFTGDPGNYGTYCVDSTVYLPTARYENRACWMDNNGSFWFFGGYGLAGVYNDLWKFCPITSSWTWVHGDPGPNVPGVYGTLGVSSPLNKPGARMGSVGWKDNSGNFWMWGGWVGIGNDGNDLWRFVPDPTCGTCAPLLPLALFVADNHVCPGTCTDFTNLSINATSYEWIFQGAVPSTSTDVNPTAICYNTPGNYDVTLIASNASGSDTTTLPNYIVVYPYSPSQSIIQSGDTLISNTGFVSYQWFYDGDTIPGATDYYYVATQSGDFSVVCIDNNGCSVEAVVLNVIASIQSTVDNQQPIWVYPNPVVDEFTIHSRLLSGSRFTINAAASILIYNVLGEIVFSAVDCLPIAIGMSTVDCRLFPSGMYFLEISTDSKLFRTKFVKQ